MFEAKQGVNIKELKRNGLVEKKKHQHVTRTAVNVSVFWVTTQRNLV
jgi:hypothetical protein